MKFVPTMQDTTTYSMVHAANISCSQISHTQSIIIEKPSPQQAAAEEITDMIDALKLSSDPEMLKTFCGGK